VTDSVIPLILERYGLRARRAKLLQDERERVWKIDAHSESCSTYALRIYRPDTRKRSLIEAQCFWLSSIAHDTGLIVPEPIANNTGRWVTPLPDGSLAVLTRWVPGRRRFRRGGPGVDVLRQVGQLMARLHDHGLTFKPPDRYRCPRWDWSGLFGAKSPWRPKRAVRNQTIDQIMRRARNVMRDLGTGPDVFGLIHGDLMQANYVIDERARVHAIDFADFGRGYFLYDTAVTLLMLKPFDRSGKQRAAFIRGYRSIRRLTPEHEALLDTFIAIRAAVLARWLLGAVKPSAADRRWAAETLAWISVGPHGLPG
jgi:Ser/Thr protein kinase RdoA (MazF antagonist)